MKNTRITRGGLVAAALMLGAFALAIAAEPQYPSRPLRIVVPFAPAGGSDVIARMIAQKLGESLAQQVIVETARARAPTSASASRPKRLPTATRSSCRARRSP
jgi:hypothetical protein